MHRVVKAIGRVLCAVLLFIGRTSAAEPLGPVVQNSFPPQKIVEAGVPVRFEIEATGASPLYYRWILRGTNLTSTNAWADVVFENNEGSQDALTAIVYNRYGNAYRQCVVRALDKPRIRVEPREVAVNAGDSFNIEVVQGTLITAQWLKDGADLAGATNYNVRRDNVTVADAGDYRVAAMKETGTTLSDPVRVRVLTTNSPPVVFDPPAELHLLSSETKSIDSRAAGFSVVVELHRQDGSVSTADRSG